MFLYDMADRESRIRAAQDSIDKNKAQMADCERRIRAAEVIIDMENAKAVSEMQEILAAAVEVWAEELAALFATTVRTVSVENWK